MKPDQPERRLRKRLDALGPAPRAKLLHVLMLPDIERAERIAGRMGHRGEACDGQSTQAECGPKAARADG